MYPVTMDENKKNSKNATKKIPRINWSLLPIKLHYILYWGGAAPATLFMPLLGKQIGIDIQAIGLIYTASSLLSVLSQPAFGVISDYFKNAKAVLMTLILITTCCFFSLLYIPPINQTENSHIPITCKEDDFKFQPSANYDSTCLNRILNKTSLCLSSRQEEFPKEFCKNRTKETGYFSESTGLYNFSDNVNCFAFQFKGCGIAEFNWTTCDASLNLCFLKINVESTKTVYATYQFWLFSLLTVAGITLVNTCYGLSDAICYEILGNKPELFGIQRLWSTCSYGIATFVAGYLNDVVTEVSTSTHYDMGYYVMLVMFSIDLFLLFFFMKPMQVTIAKFSIKDVGQVLVSFDVIVFAIGVFFIGIFTHLLYSYQFLFLESIGASQMLLGITMLVQNNVANLIFFVIASKVIDSLGHLNCVILSFGAFALRFFFYFILSNPWYMLPVEMLDGITFSICFAAMASFAKTNAEPGTEATMLGVLGGIYSGLGSAVGGFLGGLGFENLTGANTFLISAFSSAFISLSFITVKVIRCKYRYVGKFTL